MNSSQAAIKRILGSIVRYTGDSEGERHPQFVGAIGQVTSASVCALTGYVHVGVRWFTPLLRPQGDRIKGSHFELDRFEVLS